MKKYASEFIKGLNELSNNSTEFSKFLSSFIEWNVGNQATKDLREQLRSSLQEVLADDEAIDRAIDIMDADEIYNSAIHSYKNELSKMSIEEMAEEMMTWGYELPKKEEDPWHLYLLVKLTVDEGSDHDDIVNECDYTFTHDNILGSEILDYRTEQDGDSPVLYIG